MEKPKPEVVEEDFKIPVLSVLKKGTILKNIFLNTPLRDQEPTKKSHQVEEEEEEQEPILIGRHPDCHIVLDHPSISRFHLELRTKPRLRKLTATDRSSVHGTWISGTKIPPNVPVDLVEGDLIKLGSSTRVYRLLWLSMNEAFEMDNPLPPLLEEKEETHQLINDEEEAWAVEEIPSAPPLPEFFEWELPSPAKEELVDGSLRFSSVPPLVESDGTRPPSEGEQSSPVISEKRGASSSLLSRRSKPKSISFLRIQTSQSKNKLGESSFDAENNEVSGQEEKEETICRVLFDNLNGEEEEAFLSDKENVTPHVSAHFKMKKTQVDMLCAMSDLEEEVIHSDKENMEESICKDLFDNLDGKEEERKEEAFASDKENVTPQVSVHRKMKEIQVDMLCVMSPLDLDGEVNQSDKENFTPGILRELNVKESILNESNSFGKENSTLVSSSSHKLKKGKKVLQISLAKTAVLNAAEDAFYSDKENWTPDSAREVKSRKSMSRNRAKFAEQEVDEFFSDKENLTPVSLKALRPREGISKSCARREREMMKRRGERIPFQPLMECSPLRSSSSIDDVQLNVYDSYFGTDNHVHKCGIEVSDFLSQSKSLVSNEPREEKKVWNMVVDTSCFLDEESIRSLKLLEGLKGTHLIVPRIVIRELDLMKRREGLFRRSSKASSVLQWIEECMEKESWWIHVQNSQETMPVAPTPPVTPTSQFGDGNIEFGPGAFNSMVSPTFGKLMEIVSPTAEDHILDCALLFRQLKNDGQLVVLSNNTTLKINAMAEGLLCEAPKEFRESLVNPFSKRFMWVDSSPIGSTWSCSDQVGLIDNYYYNHNPTYGRGAPKAAEAVKGLKLILLHNSHYGQTN